MAYYKERWLWLLKKYGNNPGLQRGGTGDSGLIRRALMN
jgi:hypothetical protein